MSLVKFVERVGTDCFKWDIGTRYEYKDGKPLCMWVADMDLLSPQPIIDTLVNTLRTSAIGYNMPADQMKSSIKDWVYKQFGWTIHPSWLLFQPGVCPAVALFIQAFAKPGEKCVMFTPVYHPCIHALEDNGVILLNCDLEYNKITNKFEIDFEDFEKKIRDPLTKILILVNPHNPCGRVFTRTELERIGKLCLENKVLVCSDEIHWDIILSSAPTSSTPSSSPTPSQPRTTHIPFASLSPELAAITMTFTSMTKTFNCPSLQFSYAIVSDPKMKAAYNMQSQRLALHANPTFGGPACLAAYSQGEEWYLQVLDLIYNNAQTVHRLLGAKYPDYVTVVDLEGTYLIFIGFRDACVKLGFPHNYDFVTGKPLDVPNFPNGKYFNARAANTLRDFIYKECGVLMNDGAGFGLAGDGWVRMNVATDPAVVQEACTRLAALLEREIARVEKEKDGGK